MLGKVGLVLVWPFGYLCVEHLTMSSIFSPLSLISPSSVHYQKDQRGRSGKLFSVTPSALH